ncbi:hypothetical protein [Falsiroseomonas sp. HW251]|uniref:hypothetical protein n=1 Tax=Falsiroseomonas sp. HW251 TaxID=3390998 RepID=UPI003D31C353
MLMRCAGRMMAAPVMVGAGLAAVGAVAVAATAGAGLIGAAMLVKRMREERKGWREGASDAAAAPADTGEPPAEAY